MEERKGHDEPRPEFRPQVTKARPRLRLGFVVAFMVAIGAAVTVLLLRTSHEPAAATSSTTFATGCTSLTVARTIQDPQMSAADRVICLAVAGDVTGARRHLAKLTAGEQRQAISGVFNVAHPIADSGDDRSAGPIMELVVEFWPENFMAVFHAGMAEYALGDDARAKVQLEQFLTMYGNHDVWRQRAETAIAGIARNIPLDQRVAHFAE